jgi:hypothetical protein
MEVNTAEQPSPSHSHTFPYLGEVCDPMIASLPQRVTHRITIGLVRGKIVRLDSEFNILTNSFSPPGSERETEGVSLIHL